MKYISITVSFVLASLSSAAQQSSLNLDSLLLTYYQAQHYSEAADYLKKNYPEPVNDGKLLTALAYSSQMAGRLPDAEGYYQRIYKRDTVNTAVLFNIAAIDTRRGDYTKALSSYKKLCLTDSNNFAIYKQMAALYQNLGRVSDAVSCLERANKIDPQEPDAAYDLANYDIMKSLFSKADSVVSTALEADTSNMLLLFAKAQAAYHLKKYEQAVAVCTRLINAGDQLSLLITMLGSSYFNLKNYPACIHTFKRLEQSSTATETSYYYTAISYKALGNHSQAILYLRKAIKEAVSPNAGSYYSEIGDSYDHLKHLRQAVKYYQKSLLYNKLPLTYYALANLYDTQLHRKQIALTYYRKYLLSKPPSDQGLYVVYVRKRMKALNN